MNKCFWIPELVNINSFDGNWEKYNDYLYNIFSNDFLESNPTFLNKKVKARQYPMYNNKYESFFHITCGHYKNITDRLPDFERCKRIKWPRAFIENYNCSCIDKCNNYIIWKKVFKNTFRYSLLLKNEKYIVILEERPKYFILISAFPLNYSHAFHDQLEYYKQAQETENAIIR